MDATKSHVIMGHATLLITPMAITVIALMGTLVKTVRQVRVYTRPTCLHNYTVWLFLFTIFLHPLKIK